MRLERHFVDSEGKCSKGNFGGWRTRGELFGSGEVKLSVGDIFTSHNRLVHAVGGDSMVVVSGLFYCFLIGSYTHYLLCLDNYLVSKRLLYRPLVIPCAAINRIAKLAWLRRYFKTRWLVARKAGNWGFCVFKAGNWRYHA